MGYPIIKKLIFAEFGKPAPDTAHFLRYFPGFTAEVFTEKDCTDCFPATWRWGWRMNDYWKVRRLLDSHADIAIAFDADMRIVSDDARTLPLFAEKFGLCLAPNSRLLVRIDTQIGADSDGVLDETNGAGYAYAGTPIALDLRHPQAVRCADAYCKAMLANPVRGPLAWWRAAWETGFAPYLLPPQWCVCADQCGIGNEIILHIGHERVKEHYASRLAS